jgi:hypothetical protein
MITAILAALTLWLIYANLDTGRGPSQSEMAARRAMWVRR